MKTLKLALVALTLSTAAVAASAQYNYRPYRDYCYSNRDLGIGLIIGSLGTALMYESRPPVVVVPPPVYYPAPPVYSVPGTVVYLQDGTRLTYSPQHDLWIDPWGRAYRLPQ